MNNVIIINFLSFGLRISISSYLIHTKGADIYIVSANIIQICVQSGEVKCRHAERCERPSHFRDPEKKA